MTDAVVHWFLAASVCMLGGVLAVIGWLVAKKLEAYDSQHQDHYRHAAKADVHWTPRERDDLSKRLDEMSKDLKELLKRNGGARGED